MEEGLILATDIVKIFAVFWGAAAILVIFYGFWSILSRRSRVFKDEESSYGFSKTLTIINSIINKFPSPFIYPRTIPKNNEELTDEPAVLMGLIYIAIGLFMLFPLLWVYFKLK